MLFAGRIETTGNKNVFITGIVLLSGGFDTPLAIARGYSTTEDFYILIFSPFGS